MALIYSINLYPKVMYTIGILTKEPLWEEKLAAYCGDVGFRISGSFWLDKPDSMAMSNVFQDSDLIWIPTLEEGLIDCAIQAVRLSRHVLFGFPISKFPDEACTIVELAKEARVQVQVGHHEHYNPAFRSISKLVHQPQYIDFKHNIGVSAKDYEETLFHGLLTDIEMCISLVPDSLKKFQSHSVCIKEGSPPILNVRLEFNNGTAASLRLDPYASDRNIEMSVFQHQNILRAELHNGSANVERFKGLNNTGPGVMEKLWPLNGSAVPEVDEDDPGFLTQECLSFIIGLNNGIPSISSLDQGCEALKIARNIFSKISLRTD